MKKKRILTFILIITIIGGIAIYLSLNNNNLIKLNYNELIEKIENKENFILCVFASKCVHCDEFKPKIKKIAEENNIKIYYINKNLLTDEEYEDFKKNFSFDGGTPITIFFKNGEEKTTATRIEGNVKIEKIIEKLKNNGFIAK